MPYRRVHRQQVISRFRFFRTVQLLSRYTAPPVATRRHLLLARRVHGSMILVWAFGALAIRSTVYRMQFRLNPRVRTLLVAVLIVIIYGLFWLEPLTETGRLKLPVGVVVP